MSASALKASISSAEALTTLERAYFSKLMKLLFVSTSVGPLGTGLGGGVELTLYNIAQQMIQRGHEVQIVAPAGSTWDNLPLVQIPGNLQIIAQSQERTDPAMMPSPI